MGKEERFDLMLPRLEWLLEKRQAVIDLPQIFPRLNDAEFGLDDVTSRKTPNYNCIAFAAKDENQPWWPMPDRPGIPGLLYYYWPEGLPRERPATVGNFIRAFETLDYRQCRDGKPEWGYEKVAIYVDKNDVPTHMARELGDGIWYSKLGDEQDIRHHILSAVENADYGEAKYFMRKPLEGYPRWKRTVGRVVRILSGLRTSQRT